MVVAWLNRYDDQNERSQNVKFLRVHGDGKKCIIWKFFGGTYDMSKGRNTIWRNKKLGNPTKLNLTISVIVVYNRLTIQASVAPNFLFFLIEVKDSLYAKMLSNRTRSYKTELIN